MENNLDCLCAGIVVADSVCRPISRMPPPGTLTKTDRVEFAIGGCSANVAVDMTRLGLRVGLSGRIGKDLYGREIRDRLVDAGVETRLLETSEVMPTSTTFVLNVEGEDRRFIHCVGANAEYNGSEITTEAIRGAKILYVGGFCLLESLIPEQVIRLFRIARENGVTTVLNVVLSESTDTTNWLHPVLRWADFFFCNDDEAGRITGRSEPVHQAESLRSLGVRTAVVTQGERGAVLIGQNDRLRAGVFPVQPLDGTGTGDAFAAGFLYGFLQHENVRQCLTLGTAMGASCVRSMGATTGVFTANELRDFLRANPLSVEMI